MSSVSGVATQRDERDRSFHWADPLWGLGQATRGLPFMVHLNGFAMVALK